jgi:protein involved in polysaccharide export with SLBB domain
MLTRLLMLGLVGILLEGSILAQEPAKPKAPKAEPAKDEGPSYEERIKPIPPAAIPDDPPPHEGAMINFPYVIEPMDIIRVEVLEALPGRPITGERLVKPDGTISLGFYGEIHVRGLTAKQVKLKVILHLRRYLIDTVLGLIDVRKPDEPAVEPLPKPGSIAPRMGVDAPDLLPPGAPASPFDAPKGSNPSKREPVEDPPTKPVAKPVSSSGRVARLAASRARLQDPAQAEKTAVTDSPPQAKPSPKAEAMQADELDAWGMHPVYIDPVESDRVFIDITAFKSKVYFVQGDVGTPGRIPCTGNDTVLDAVQYVGGFLPTADPSNIHLYRPARGGKPARDYKIDIEAIKRGDARANLQIFDGDRLVVGQNELVKRTAELDRIQAPINSMVLSLNNIAALGRNLGLMVAPFGEAADGTMSPEAREKYVNDWIDFLWSASLKNQEKMLDEAEFRREILRRLKVRTSPEFAPLKK